MGTKNSQTTQTNTPSDQALQAYSYVGNVASQAASQPLQQYQGPRVAGFSPDQQAAFSAVQNAQGIGTPFINTASQYAAQGANPISGVPNVGTSSVNYSNYDPSSFNASELAQYYSPYQQSVIDATLANINRNNGIQQGQLLGNAIQSGASPFGGDRAGIAAAELARNQALATNQTIADLSNQGFQTALSAYQNQMGRQDQAGLANAANALAASQGNAANTLAASGQNATNYLNTAQNNASRASNAAEQFAGLGNQAQSQALTGASALLQTGSLQQQLAQQQLDIPYQNFQQQQQYPLDMAKFLVDAFNGNQTNLGSTSTRTQPSGNTLTSILGGLASLGGLFMKDGGAVRDRDHWGWHGGDRHGFWHGDHGGNDNQTGTTATVPTQTTPALPSQPAQGGIGVASAMPAYTTNTNNGYGISVPMLNPQAFAYHGTPIDWSTAQAANNNYQPTNTIPSWINALPQISQSAMPAPKSYPLPSGILGAIQNLPSFVTDNIAMARGGSATGGIAAEGGYDPTPLGDVPVVVPYGLDGATGSPIDITPAGIDGAPDLPPPPQAMPDAPPTIDMPDPEAAQAGPAPSGIAALFSGDPSQADAYLASPKAALLQAGLAMMASKSPFVLQGIGEGLGAGVDAYVKQRQAAAQLDANPTVDDAGPTIRVYYPSSKKWVDTGIPSTKYLDYQAKRAETEKPIIVNDRLLDPNDYHVIGDFSDAAAPKSTNDILNFEYAKNNGYTGSFAQFQSDMQKAGATTINTGPTGVDYGDPPKDMAWARNPDGSVALRSDPNTGFSAPIAVPVSGGPAAAAAAEDVKTAQAGLENAGAQALTAMDATHSIRNEIANSQLPVTGTLSRPFAMLSNTPAGRVRSYVKALQSGVALNSMLKLKQASSTGATGFGALSQKELDILINSIGALDPDTAEPDIFLKTLDNIDRQYASVIEDIKANVSPERIRELGLDALFGGDATRKPSPDITPVSGEPIRLNGDAAEMDRQYDALPPGTTFIGPDGVTRTKPGV